MNEVYFNHEELINYLSSKYSGAADIGEKINLIEGCFILSSSDNAKVYLFEVSDGYTDNDIEEVNDFLISEFDLPIVLIPSRNLKYVATIEQERIGIKGKILAIRDAIRSDAKRWMR